MSKEGPSATLARLVNGFRVSQAISVAARLGIADLLEGGARTSDELAAAAGAHPDALYRMLRALAAVGVFHEDDDRRFSLTEVGEGLRGDHPESLKGWAAFIGSPYFWQAWGHLAHSVRTGENAFRHVHGTDVWTYRERHPDLSAEFDAAMTAQSRTSARAVVGAYDFSEFGLIADIAGGNGLLLTAILKENPRARGILFDQAHVVPGAERTIEEAGIADRCEIVSGSFFESVPDGADAYLLKNIIHDWDDPEAIAILRSCRAAMTSSSKLLIIEMGIRGPNEGAGGKFMDLNMLVSPGGRDRTEDEMRALLKSAGFELRRTIDTSPDGMQVFEAVPV